MTRSPGGEEAADRRIDAFRRQCRSDTAKDRDAIDVLTKRAAAAESGVLAISEAEQRNPSRHSQLPLELVKLAELTGRLKIVG